MTQYRLAGPVEDRLLALLDESAAQFGEAARRRYARLILQAMRDVATAPDRPGAKQNPVIDPKARFYHLRHSRLRVPARERVGTPRHVLIYEADDEGIVNILGLTPDMIPADMALPRFLPDRFA